MNNVIDYKIVQGLTIDVIESKVKELLKDGWHPIGSVSMMSIDFHQGYGREYFMSQVMVLTNEN